MNYQNIKSLLHPNIKNTKNIISITGLRGIASMMVVLFHFSKGFVAEDSFTREFFRIGWTGVEIFFVISGFVIVWSMLNNNYQYKDFGTFLLKRLIRIEPPYIISVIIIIILGYLSSITPGFEGNYFGFDFKIFLFHLGYLVRLMNESWLNPVYWSLEIEFHFYLLIALIFPILVKNRYLLVSSITIILLSSNFKNPYSPLVGYLDIFLLGIISAFYVAENISDKIFLPLIIITLISIWFHHKILILTICSSTFILIFWGNNILNHAIFSFFGKISFSLYLLHVPFGGRIINIAKRFDFSEPQKLAVIFIAICFSVGISFLFYLIIEKPFHNWAKGLKY